MHRALLISSPHNGLTATGPSLARMRVFLDRQGFVITDDHCIDGDNATRAAIVTAFAALIESTSADDIVVVYYAGHGGLFPDRVGAAIQPHPVLEPMDIMDSDETHFNGLLGAEVRLFIRALARLCDNVTAIFDCCHASGLLSTDEPSDADERRDREATTEIARRAGERIARRRAESRRPDRARSDRRPESTGAVRLVASSASERAYAHGNPPILLFTDTLVDVLEDHALPDKLTWEQIVRIVRARIQMIRPEQRPGVEGARARRPFTTLEIPEPIDHFHVERIGQRLRLAAGAAAGIRSHDTFEVYPYAGHDTPLCRAQAVVVAAFHSFLEAPRDRPPLPSVMFARRVRGEPVTLAARLATADADAAAAASLRAGLESRGHRLRDCSVTAMPSGWLDLIDECDPGGAPQRVAHLRLADPNTPDELARATRRVERWSGLAAQIGHAGLGPLTGCYTLTWGRRAGDRLEPLRPGEVLLAGEPLALCLHNPGRVSALHIQAYRVRADRCIDAWRDVDGGLAVMTGHELLMHDTFEPLPDLPAPQREWLVIAIGDGAFDLAAVPTPAGDRPRDPVRSAARHPGEASRVEILGFSYMLAAAP